ncbi:MAG: hypothetical protein WC821_03160 [archaeon]|jgi:hypothetical protein
MDFVLTTELLVQISLVLISLSVIVILVSAFLILNKRKTVEEQHAQKILDSLQALKEGKTLNKEAKSEPVLAIKKEEHSLKSMLIKKFKPKIESQLSTKVNVLDFNAKEENFLVLIEISGVKLLLTLDSSGKIIDYKKVKKN